MDPHLLGWERPGLPVLSNLAGPIQHELRFWMPGGVGSWLSCVIGRVFGVVHCLITLAFCSSLTLAMFGRERRRCSGVFWLEKVWNRFLLSTVKGRPVPCRFCGELDGDGHLFWGCTFPPLVEICENPEFHDLMGMDKSNWPRWLRWHGWLPLLSGTGGGSPWAGYDLRVHWALALPICFLSGRCLVGFMWKRWLLGCLMRLFSGLMGAW